MGEKKLKSQRSCPTVTGIHCGGISPNANEGLISIIIPAYNTGQYLYECIASIMRQTYRNFEVLIIDDGSTDDTGKNINEFGKKDNRIIPLHQENKGVSAARNYGLRVAKGEYITFLDSDDYVDQEWLKKRLDNMKAYNADCCMCGCDYVKNGMENLKKLNSQPMIFDARSIVLKLCLMKDIFPNYEITSVCGGLYCKSLLEGLRFNEKASIGEDFLFKFDALSKTNTVVCIEDKLYKYRILENSTMRNGYSKKKTNTITALEEFIEQHKDLEYEIKGALICRCVNIAIVILMMIPIEKEYHEERKRIIGFIDKYKKQVLSNKKARKKVKISLCLSGLVGYDNMQRIFKRMSGE